MKKKKMSAGKIAALSGAALIGLGALMGGGGEKDPEPAAEPVRTVTAAPAEPTATPRPTAVPTATPEPTPTPYRIHYHDAYTTVYVSKNGVIHFKPDCSGMKHYTEMSLEKADAAGYKYCEHCG